VYSVARRLYALFQLHTTPERAAADNEAFGAQGAWHVVTCAGPDVGLVVLDTRTERTQDEILSHASWNM
jgi:hypothetical protein